MNTTKKRLMVPSHVGLDTIVPGATAHLDFGQVTLYFDADSRSVIKHLLSDLVISPEKWEKLCDGTVTMHVFTQYGISVPMPKLAVLLALGCRFEPQLH